MSGTKTIVITVDKSSNKFKTNKVSNMHYTPKILTRPSSGGTLISSNNSTTSTYHTPAQTYSIASDGFLSSIKSEYNDSNNNNCTEAQKRKRQRLDHLSTEQKIMRR